jgi:hypothetical protein
MMCTLGILAENTAPGRLRSLSIGICIAGLPLGGTIGFTVAAPLADATRLVHPSFSHSSIVTYSLLVSSWRSVFFLVAGLDLLSLIGVFFLAKHQTETEGGNDKRIDWIGGILFTAGAVFLFFCLSQALSESKGFGTPCESFCVAVTICVLWLTRFLRYHRPLGYELSAIGLGDCMGSLFGDEDSIPANHADQYCHAAPLSGGGCLLRGGEYSIKPTCQTQLDKSRLQFCCISSYAGLMYSSQIYYQRYLDMKAIELMVSDCDYSLSDGLG